MSLRTLTAATAAAMLASLAAAQDNRAAVERGKYLVENAGLCQHCHTPKLENGEPDRSKWLKGAVLDVGPLPGKTIANWHKTAQDLTPSGTLWKKWGPEAIVNFLVTGKNPKGGAAGPPMPAYRLSKADAVAVVEYLKTLP